MPLEKAEGHDFQKNRVPRSQGHDKGHDTENRVPDRVPIVSLNRVPGVSKSCPNIWSNFRTFRDTTRSDKGHDTIVSLIRVP